jgi:hypothetical protein
VSARAAPVWNAFRRRIIATGQGSGAEFLFQAAVREDRQAEARLGQALLGRQSVDREDLGRPEPVGGE